MHIKLLSGFTKPNILTLGLLVALILPFISLPEITKASIANTRLDAWGTQEVGTGWTNSFAGVPIYSNGATALDYRDCGGNIVTTYAAACKNSVNSVTTGAEWQCVELFNRFLMTQGLITSTWSGYGNTLINASPFPTGFSQESANATTYINPGDAITFDNVPAGSGSGHVAIVENVNGSTITLGSQNTQGIYFTVNWNTTTHALTQTYLGSSYTIQAIIHRPGTTPPPPSSYLTFQANNSQLFSYTNTGTNTNQGMLGHTSPATTQLSDSSYETAFVANTGALYVLNSNNQTTSIPTGQGVAANTSPSITGFSGGGWQVVFQGADGNLHGWDSSGHSTNFGQPMAANTSPAIAALTSGGWRVAYQSNTNSLNLYSVGTGGSSNTNLGQGMAAGTSPSITGLNGSTWIASFQANSGSAYAFNSAVGYGQSLGLGMAGGTSPVITSLTTSLYDVLAQANNGLLYLRTSTNGYNTNLGQGMLGSTSPSAIRTDNSNYTAAFQANTGNLYTYNSTTGASTNTNQGMAAYTSPAMGMPVAVN